MNILHVIITVNPEYGGPIEGIFTASEVLKEHGCRCEIVCLDSPQDPWVANCPLTVYPMGMRNGVGPSWLKRLPGLRYGYTPHFVPWLKANAGRYDAVIVNGLWNYSALGTWRALGRGGVPYFVFTHGMLDPYFNKVNPIKTLAKQLVWWVSEGRLIAGAKRVFFVSEEEGLLARKSFWPFRCRGQVLPFGTKDVAGGSETQVKSFLAAVPQVAGRDFILYLSRIHPKKGCDLLIEAFAAIAAKEPGLDLVVAGPDSVGWAKTLRARAAELGLAERIHWPGMLKGDSKWGAFRAASAFILPSHQENFGIVIAEAMACGTPVLTTFKVNIWREVRDLGAGLVASDDLEGITDMLLRYLHLSADEKQRMGASARNGFVAKFDIRAMAPQFIEALRSS